MKILIWLVLLALILSGCETMRIKDGELHIGENTTAGFEDGAVGTVCNKF